MRSLLFFRDKERQQKYAALIEAAKLHDYVTLSQAATSRLDLDYVVPGIGKSALQVLSENNAPGDEAFIDGLNNSAISAKYNLLRMRRINEDLLTAALEHNFSVPIDCDGYIVSYDAEDIYGMLRFFNFYGFVVVRNVLTQQECEKTIDEIWEVNCEMSGGKVKRDDENTWGDHWPGIRSEGISGGYAVMKPQFVRNRCNLKIHRVASSLLSDSKLLTNIDRFGIFRPTKSHPEWKTTRNVHLDMNPVYWYESTDAHEDAELLGSLSYDSPLHFISENNVIGSRATELGKKTHIQGLINLTDNREEDGGFLICPGMHTKLAALAENKLELWRKQFGDKNKFCVLPEEGNEDIHQRAIRVTARAGSLIFWSQLSPHGSAPNRSANFRYAQYIKMFPAASVASTRAKARREAIRKMLEKAGIRERDLSDYDKKVYGLAKW